jgi:hypothetical protein
LKGGDSRLSRRFLAWLRVGSCFAALGQGRPWSYLRSAIVEHHPRAAERPGQRRALARRGVEAIFGVFFFVNLFVQDVWGYSALRTGVAFLPRDRDLRDRADPA